MSRRKKSNKSEKLDTVDAASTSVSQSTNSVQANAQTTTSQTKPSHKSARRFSLKDHLIYWSLWFFMTSPIVAPVVLGIVYVPFYRASLTKVEFTVDRRERVVKGGGENTQSYYLVWTQEGEVFCVADTWSFLRFDSSDRYGKLHERAAVSAKVAGWRIPFLSWYRNVVEIDDVKSPSTLPISN